jgi:MoaA/NifB/PqqE/SkfB family radical SAM enzyme
LQLAGYFHGERAFAGPTTVQVDLTDACNQDCVVCWLHAPSMKERNRARLQRPPALPWDLYLRLLDELKDLGTEEIYFAGGGEPMAYPRAWDALAECLRRGLVASLHTNFSLVDDDGVQRLLDLGVHHLTVSVWAGSRASYEATHPSGRGETFDAVTRRLAELNRRRADRPKTKLYHVLTANNVHDVAGMLKLAEDLGCDAVELAVADLVPGATDPYGIDAAHALAAKESVLPWTRRALWRRPRLLGWEALLARLDAIAAGAAVDSALVHGMPCFAGWTYARVMADGRVIPCLKAHRVPSGDLHREGFASIWHGARQRAFRRAAREFRKDDGYFALIGNDPAAACGCERGCDNLADNEAAWARLRSLTTLERGALRTLARLPEEAQRALGVERPGAAAARGVAAGMGDAEGEA